MSLIHFKNKELSSLSFQLKKEFLEANAVGAYSSSTISFCNTRKYHGLLVVRQPQISTDNYVLLSDLDETILMNGAKAPHHNYVGDSIIGENSNLGSGTKIANLRLDKKEIVVVHKGVKNNTGRKKLGAIIGSNVNTGINTSINTGTILGNNVKVGPNSLISGTYESQSTII